MDTNTAEEILRLLRGEVERDLQKERLLPEDEIIAERLAPAVLMRLDQWQEETGNAEETLWYAQRLLFKMSRRGMRRYTLRQREKGAARRAAAESGQPEPEQPPIAGSLYASKWAHGLYDRLTREIVERVPLSERVASGMELLSREVPSWPIAMRRQRCHAGESPLSQLVDAAGFSCYRDEVLRRLLDVLDPDLKDEVDRADWMMNHGFVVPFRADPDQASAMGKLWWAEARSLRPLLDSELREVTLPAIPVVTHEYTEQEMAIQSLVKTGRQLNLTRRGLGFMIIVPVLRREEQSPRVIPGDILLVEPDRQLEVVAMATFEVNGQPRYYEAWVINHW